MKRLNKRGISPVVATVLLISIALLLAAIIFLWARGLLTEQAQKFDEPIENACGDVSFDAEVIYNSGRDVFELRVINRGNVPLNSVQLQAVSGGDIKEINEFNLGRDSYQTLRSGETSEVHDIDAGQVSDGDTLRAVPTIMGQKGVERSVHYCDESHAVDLTVKGA